MRFEWQCPTCAAQIGNEKNASMLTCPFCGSLLISDFEQNKFYLVKKENGWYFFPKKYIGEHDGYIKYGEEEDYYTYREDAWYVIHRGIWYKLVNEDVEIDTKECRGEVKEIWGALPIVAPPGTELKVFKEERTLRITTKKKVYVFERTPNQG
ncbi:MAG: hypothetical protein GXO25_07545 [Euryarchaeota archaeon]|nr:hypothetical protein [Euryarchaeota archaeon]